MPRRRSGPTGRRPLRLSGPASRPIRSGRTGALGSGGPSMKLLVDTDHLGPSESEGRRSRRLTALAPTTAVQPDRLVVVAPHPDDEVLGTAGLIQQMLVHDIAVEVIAVTDGDASHAPAGM